ncbi:LysR family transcriptional regulator [Paracidovorax anthurii]|uniref:LysR family transcriptional regulator n=1 Tax=Paracidovorax anthurii TaxID=78229 RepID=A0A328Z0Z0_9BURK|nr:LysR family transcriptional regulator [Paracidovorax anthurii]RAR76477.1 LysR family transcriptional regulator [Paracidovorax anthurii]
MPGKKIDALWSHVHWLNVLADQGSFTAAARHLRVSKATMSHHIGELEAAAGVPLVRRTTRSVQLTEAGRQLVDATGSAFMAIARGFESVQDLADAPRGLVRVTAPVAFARQQLVPRLPQFLTAHPQIRVELDMSDALASLAREGFDLAIRHSASAPETHVAWKICDTSTVLVASRGYLQRRGTPSAPRDLLQHECLYYPRSQESVAWLLEPTQRDEEGQRVSIPVRGAFAANNSEALRDAAVAGLGIALLPDFSANSALESGRLVRVLPGWRPVGPFASQILAIRPYTPHVPRSVQALVAFLRASFSTGFDAKAL